MEFGNGDFVGVAHTTSEAAHYGSRHRGVAGDDFVQHFFADFNEAAIRNGGDEMKGRERGQEKGRRVAEN